MWMGVSERLESGREAARRSAAVAQHREFRAELLMESEPLGGSTKKDRPLSLGEGFGEWGSTQ